MIYIIMSPNESNKTSISRDIKSGFPIKTIKWLEFSNFIHVFCMTLKFSKISIFDKSMYTWSWRNFDKLILVKLYVIYIYIRCNLFACGCSTLQWTWSWKVTCWETIFFNMFKLYDEILRNKVLISNLIDFKLWSGLSISNHFIFIFMFL